MTVASDDISDFDTPHAFHQSLPPHHRDSDGIPYITKFAAKKAKSIVELALSMQLTEDLFASEEEEAEEDEDDEEIQPIDSSSSTETLSSLKRKCARLQSHLSSLEQIKYGGISQREWCDIVLHLLRLVTATCSSEEVEGENRIRVHFEPVGYLYTVNTMDDHEVPALAVSQQDIDRELARDFALPTSARELLLSVIIRILSRKGPLRGVSNSAIFLEGDADERMLLILHWKVFYKMLLRTAPHLDEHKAMGVAMDSTTRYNTIVKRTVQLIRDARHFFDQGERPDGTPNSDATATEVWEMVKNDVLFQSHTHACYRGTIFLYLFSPSRCTEAFYVSVMPLWLEAWTNIDRCPEFDFLWLAIFCRARKYVSMDSDDWAFLRRRVLTHASYWLQIPIGGVGDKSFPRARNPRTRSCPPRLKIFAGGSSSYDEGIDFVAKLAKILVSGLGAGLSVDSVTGARVSEGTNDLLRFLTFVAPYFNPSNIGAWTFTLGAFLHYFAFELCCRVGEQAGKEILIRSHPKLSRELQNSKSGPLPAHELVSILNACLPLCQQALYSKNGHVGRAAEAAMVYLVQIDPVHTTPSLLDFAAQALDVSAVNLAHQAPSALSTLARLVQPALRGDPIILLARLPTLLRLTLAGIDSNDQNKTIRTLIFYRSLTSWMPVGGEVTSWPSLSTSSELQPKSGTLRLGKDLMKILVKNRSSAEYLEAIRNLPEDSLMKQPVLLDTRSIEVDRLIIEEASCALEDWALEFLDRVFELLRVSGEREKAGKSGSGMASRYTSSDVNQARNFSRVLKETLLQLFGSTNDKLHALLTGSVSRFLADETLPAAAKDASLLCQAAAAVRKLPDGSLSSPGLDALVPILCEGMKHHSTKTLVYRVRCLAGSVRRAGFGVLKHQAAVAEALDVCLASNDRHVFKTGCKLLRHTLATLTESYVISNDFGPRIYSGDESKLPMFGRSAELNGDPVMWHVPTNECVEFAWLLLEKHLYQRMDQLRKIVDGRSILLTTSETTELRRCLRVVRYSIRGGASLLLDLLDSGEQEKREPAPYEKAVFNLLSLVGTGTRSGLMGLRGQISSLIIVLMSIIASESFHPDIGIEDDQYKAMLVISGDPKVCKEAGDIALLLLTRRGSAFRSQELKTIWKAQKQLAADFGLSALAQHVMEYLQASNLFDENVISCFKDGEDGGKTVPRRLLAGRLQLFHDSLQRQSSFEVPRSLRLLEQDLKLPRNILFTAQDGVGDFVNHLETLLHSKPRPLASYEGIVDGLFAMCCHSNTRVRASSVSVIDYALTRFGWLASKRIPRLLSAIRLDDVGLRGKFGLPSCADLVGVLDQQGKRKKLSEAVKGICSIVSLQRSVKRILGSESTRLAFAQTFLTTDNLLSLVPAEELQKIVMYLQTVFSPFRSRFFWLPRTSTGDNRDHKAILELALDILSEKGSDKGINDETSEDKGAVHWRKLLMACWFLQAFVDRHDMVQAESSSRIWETCFYLIETQSGQPLQRVALGLLGKLISLSPDLGILHARLIEPGFCELFCNALVYDHREDVSMSGGHDAQWSSGVEDILRDSARHIAPRNIFPFQRTSQSTGAFKVAHSQMVETILCQTEKERAAKIWSELLTMSETLAASPPSEDQRNQLVTSAEIFAGLGGAFLRGLVVDDAWTKLLDHLETVMGKIPFSMSGAYFDALRYMLQFTKSSSFLQLTSWLVNKIGSTLWQPNGDRSSETLSGSDSANPAIEGFTEQSKWLYLFSAILIELDETGSKSTLTSALVVVSESDDLPEKDDLTESWKLVSGEFLSRLTDAFGHPYDSCRDHVSRCLFRICYCHRKQVRLSSFLGSGEPIDTSNTASGQGSDPGTTIVEKLAAIPKSEGQTFLDKCNALSTARRFVSYCVQLGEAKAEYSDYVIPLLPLVFDALRSTVEEEIKQKSECSADENTAKRAMETEVTKLYRSAVAEISVTSVISYGNTNDISRVLAAVEKASNDHTWQIRHAGANFLRCFQGAHKYLFLESHVNQTMNIVASLLADERREVSDAAMAALTGLLAASPSDKISLLVKKYATMARKSKMRRKKNNQDLTEEDQAKERKRTKDQQISVFFLCASILSQPYETPPYVPVALAAISKHSFEKSAPLHIRDTVKKCCAEYKKTHMSDNWALHKKAFTDAQLEALEDVVSSPHYYA